MPPKRLNNLSRLFGIALAAFAIFPRSARAETEYEAKANLLRFVAEKTNWRETDFASSEAPFIIGIRGDNSPIDGFQLRITGPSGLYVIEASTNMYSWLPISTNNVLEGTWHYTDYQAIKCARRFYRVLAR